MMKKILFSWMLLITIMNKMHEDVCIIELCFVPYSYDEEKLTFKAKVCINIHTDELFHVKKKKKELLTYFQELKN